jgi:hypothetical protein
VNRRRHRPSCGHCPRVRALGAEFRAWRASWEVQEEAASYGYATEAREFSQSHPAPTFRRFLVDMTGAGWPMSTRSNQEALA